MSWTMLWAPLAVAALASLVGWGVARWLSPVLAFVLVIGLGLAAVAMVVAAAILQGLDGLTYAVWVVGVILPAAIGTGLGAMMARRGR